MSCILAEFTMYKSNRRGRDFGEKKFGKSFGGRSPWKRDAREFGDKPSFKATCAECGASCSVPFRPNGSKPVLCNDCFGGNEKFSGRSDFRKSFEKNSYTAPGSASNHTIEERLKMIEKKLDQILSALDA